MNKYRTIGEAWLNTVQACQQIGRRYTIQKGSYEGRCRLQLARLAFVITNPGERPLGVEYRGKPISDDDSIQRYFEDYLINPDPRPDEQYTYGQRIAPYLDQLARRIRDYPMSNQHFLPVAQPGDLDLDDPPCLQTLTWQVIDRQLQLWSHWRSWDALSGLPTNLGGLQLLNEMLAEWTGFQPGALVCTSSGAHVYLDHVRAVTG